MKHLTVAPPERGDDIHGSGSYLASRGRRKHNGVDYACAKGSKILSVCEGVLTKIGYPYSPTKHPEKGHLRYVQISDREGNDIRYFYIAPLLPLGSPVRAGDVIGEAQGLGDIYEGITEHIHFEVKDASGGFLNPHVYLESL